MSKAIVLGRWRPQADLDRILVLGFGALVAVPLVLFVGYPLTVVALKSVTTTGGELGLDNYAQAFSTPNFWTVVGNSFEVASAVTVVSVTLGFAFAYAMQRSCIPAKTLLRSVAMMPMFAPSLVQALGLIFLLGRNGLVSRWLGIEIDIYGFWGIFLADCLYAFPQAFLVLSAALAVADARPYEAAQVLGAGKARIFFTVTLPSVKFGVVSAAFLVFTVTITDFGNAMVIGGDYSVLATEIYNQVSGQMNFNLGSVIAIVLLVPVAVAFGLDRVASRRQFALISERSVPLAPVPDRTFDAAMLIVSLLVCAAILAVIGMVVFASFVKLWPYNLSLTLKNYVVDVQNGYAPLWTSIWVSLLTAVLAVVFVVGGAYVTHKIRGPFTRFLYFLSVLPAAVPGMVLGLAYVFAFNDPSSPVYLVYGTVVLLAICNLYHYHAQGFLTATTSLKQISDTFDEASRCLGASFVDTMRRVTLPMIVPTILAVGVFFFMRSMVTLSAVIFLVTPSVNLAAVSVMLLDDAGNITQAAAFSTCIIGVVLVALVLLKGLLRYWGVRARSLIS